MIKAPAAVASVRYRRPRLGARVRTWLLTGIVVADPLTVTVVLVWWFVYLVDTAVERIVPVRSWPDSYLPFSLPGFGVVFAFIALTLLGCLAANLAGRTLISVSENVLNRIPVVRSIYRSAKQIFETLFSAVGTSLRRVGLVEFPAKGQWSLVFISSPPSAVIEAGLPSDPEPWTSVFMPCAPNPTTGFYFYLPARDVAEVLITPEEAAKLIMSCGVIQPEGQAAMAAPAAHACRTDPPDKSARVEPQLAASPDRIPSYG